MGRLEGAYRKTKDGKLKKAGRRLEGSQGWKLVKKFGRWLGRLEG